MKKYAYIYAALALLFAVLPVTAQQSEAPWTQESPVHTGRELARMQTISYNSEELARTGGHEESAYLQPLTEWKKSLSADGRTATYAGTFKMPFSWIDRQLFFYIGSAEAPYEVYVNGARAGYNQSSRTAAEFNVTEYAAEGMNTIEVVVHGDALSLVLDNSTAPAAPEITGETYIVAQPRVRVRDIVSRVTLDGRDAIIELGILLKTHLLNPKTIRTHYRLYSPDGEQVAAGRRDTDIEMRSEDTVRFIVNVRQARLWSPEEPNLYTLVLQTQNENRNWEFIAYNIGIRTVDLEGGRLFVNRRAFPISMSRYEAKASGEATAKGLRELRAKGTNMVLVDRPQPEWFYRACDQTGLLVCDQADIDTRQSGESRQRGGNPSNDPAWLGAYTDRVAAMMGISANHPSVIAFSLAGKAANGYNLYESYVQAVSKLYETDDMRPVIYLDAGGEWNTDAVTPETAAAMPHAVDGRMVFTDSDTPAFAPVPVTVGEQDTRGGVYAVTNNMYFRELRFDMNYVVKQGRKKVSEGSVPVAVEPQATVYVTIPYGKAERGNLLNVDLSADIPGFDTSEPTIRIKKNFSPAY